jgi:hypothetical protein
MVVMSLFTSLRFHREVIRAIMVDYFVDNYCLLLFFSVVSLHHINFFYLTKQFSARHFNEQLLTFYVHIMPFREEQNLARCEKT